MSRVLLNITNHELTEEQKKGWERIINLPENLKKLWSSIPPDFDCEQVKHYLTPLLDWISENKDSSILVAGDFCAFKIVLEHAIAQNIEVFQATTKRETVEVKNPDGTVVKRSVFKHVKFRKLN